MNFDTDGNMDYRLRGRAAWAPWLVAALMFAIGLEVGIVAGLLVS